VKKLTISILIPAIIIALAWWYIFNLIPQTVTIENWEKYIPADAGLIIETDAARLRDVLMDEGMSSPSEMRNLVSNMDSVNRTFNVPTGAMFEIFSTCLHLPEKLVLFETAQNNSGYFHVIFPLKSRENLDAYLMETPHTNLGNDNFLLEKERLGIFLDKNVAILSFGNNLPFEIYQTICKNSFRSKKSNESINWFGGIGADIHGTINRNSSLWNYDQLPLDNLELSGKNSNGKTNIEINLFTKSQKNIFRPTRTIIEDDQSLLNMSICWNINEYNFPDILEQINQENLNSYGLKSNEVNDIWNGEIALNVTAPSVIEEEFITYEYDANFERIEKVETKKNVVPNFEIYVGSDVPTEKFFEKKQWVKQVDHTNDFILYPLQKINYLEIENGFLLRTDTLVRREVNVDGIRGTGHCDIDNFLINYPNILERKMADAVIYSLDDISFTVQNEKYGGSLSAELIYQDERTDGLINALKLLTSLGY